MTNKSRLRAIYILSDWITTNVAFLLFNLFRYHHLPLPSEGYTDVWQFLSSPKLVGEQIFFPLFFLFIYWLSGYYNNPYHRSRLQEFYTTVSTALFNSLLIYLALLTNDQITVSTSNYLLIISLFLLLGVCTYSGRLLITLSRMRQIRLDNNIFRTIIIGSSDKVTAMRRQLESSLANLGYKVKGYVLTDIEYQKEYDGLPVYHMEDLNKVCESEHISQLILTPQRPGNDEILSLLNKLFSLDIPIKIAPDLTAFLTSGIRLQDIYGEPFVDLTSPRMRESTKNIKRTLDVVISAFALMVLAIPMSYIAIRIRMSSRGPVIYRQERLGVRRRPFTIFKFRTMRTDAEKEGPRLSSDNDERITPLGRVLRKYRIDELPQFWNVLRGDMSLVGPRPEREYYVHRILDEAPYYTLLHQVRPGITSWGMVKYGYASDVPQMIARSQYDLIYLSNMSLAIDIKILIYTIRTVVLGKGK